MNRMLVIIPAFNEEASLEFAVAAVRAGVPEADIAVIDDGSRDNTAAIIERLGTIALRLPRHAGVGAAEQAGFRYALQLEYDLVIRNDADGQHNPSDIPVLVKPVREQSADVAIGSRYLEGKGYRSPGLRRLGNRVLAWITSLACRQKITDPTSGFRAFNRKAIRYCADHYPSRYPEAESLVQFAGAGLRMVEIPVTMYARYAGRSTIGPVDATVYMIKALWAICLHLLRPPRGQARADRDA